MTCCADQQCRATCGSGGGRATGGGTATGGGGTATGGGGGGSELDAGSDAGTSAGDGGCADLETAYGAAVQAAKLCNPNSLIEPCTEMRPSSITCGCPTFINAGSGVQLDAFQAAFTDAGCLPSACPRCTQLDAGVCTAIQGGTSDEGECIDR